MSLAIGAGIAGASAHSAMNAYPNSIVQSSGTGITMPGGMAQFMPQWDENNHQFNCQKVENGWTVSYRGKTYISPDIDSLMDQIKAAMVLERIEK